MTRDPFRISLETLVGLAPMLGYDLEDRRSIRERQDLGLVQAVQAHTSVSLRDPSQEDLFCVAPFDILMTRNNGRSQFHVLEINGTGIGGLTNMAKPAIGAILEDLRQFAERLVPRDAVVLVACSGNEENGAPRPNRLVHEKILYVEALKEGFERSERTVQIFALAQLAGNPRRCKPGRPAIVLGYMKEYLKHLRTDETGRLFLFDRQVHAAINDRFCLNILYRLEHQIDLNSFQTMNRCYLAGGDKGFTYSLLNEYLTAHSHRCLPDSISFEHVPDRAALIDAVVRWVREGRKAVIKPQGTGHGHGIEFFLSADEEERSMVQRIDASLRLTESLYGLPGGALPYTVCEFIDTHTLASADHPLVGHKYEMRIAVYRDGNKLKAFPSIVKISSEKYDAKAPSHLSLINNITASSHAKNAAGVEFMLPLANRETLRLIGLEMEDLLELCAALTGFTRYILDQVQDQPERFGLPAMETVSSAGM